MRSCFLQAPGRLGHTQIRVLFLHQQELESPAFCSGTSVWEVVDSLTTPQGWKVTYFITELSQAEDRDNQICLDKSLHVLGRLLRDYHLQYHRQLCAHHCTQHSLY